MVPGSLYSTHLDGAMRRWLGVFAMGSAHDLCPGRRSETHGPKRIPRIARDDNEGQEAAPMFLERYDSKRVREWGSANDVI